MWPNLQETVDLVTFAIEILNGKLHFLCSVSAIKIHEAIKTPSLLNEQNLYYLDRVEGKGAVVESAMN